MFAACIFQPGHFRGCVSEEVGTSFDSPFLPRICPPRGAAMLVLSLPIKKKRVFFLNRLAHDVTDIDVTQIQTDKRIMAATTAVFSRYSTVDLNKGCCFNGKSIK